MNDETIRYALRALADADAAKEASPQVEIRLRKAFRSRRRRRVLGRATVWMSAVAAVVAVFVFLHRSTVVAPLVRVVPKNATEQAQPRAVILPEPDRGQRTVQVRKSVRTRPVDSEEIVTDFFPLLDPAPPFQRGQMLRIQVPASAMQMVGLPVHEDRLSDPVQADVLIGEEGLPRAIRFVKLERTSKRE